MWLTMISRTCIARIIHAARRVLACGLLAAAASAAAQTDEARLQERLLEVFPKYDPSYIRRSPVTGLYEVGYGSRILYMTSDGRYMFLDGDLLDLQDRKQPRNLTELSRAVQRRAALESYGAERMIVYPATAPLKHAITVVTDTSCMFCRRFHQHIDELGGMGIEVRYLLYPRAGANSDSYRTMVSVWCSEDRREMLTQAKRMEPVPPRACASPVLEHIELVGSLGVSSTPSIFRSDGVLIRGYRPPEELLALLGD